MSRLMRSAFILSVLAGASAAHAQFGFGVNSSGQLFRFSLAAPAAPVTTIGNVGFVPEGIDFRPGTGDLYAVDVGATTTQLYKINALTGAASPVGAGFASSGAGYNLTGNQTFGFDFNPTTLQADNSIRIRMVSSNGSNLRLNDSTGLIAATDTALNYAAGNAPAVDSVAYINSASATIGGTTTLFGLDVRNNQLVIQNPPNAGTLTAVGPFGVSITNTQLNTSFDILTDPLSVDTGIGGDTGYAVLRRPDAPLGGPLGAYVLYNVNLATGGISNGALVDVGSPADFTGGFAVSPSIPAPGVASTLALAGPMLARRRR